jgi:hypothetical protein
VVLARITRDMLMGIAEKKAREASGATANHYLGFTPSRSCSHSGDLSWS